jgi:hypothetical protein
VADIEQAMLRIRKTEAGRKECFIPLQMGVYKYTLAILLPPFTFPESYK